MDKPNSYWENPYQEDELEGDYYIDTSLDKYESYEHYLDDQMNPEDMFYLEDIELARDLISVGYHGKGEIYTRETFEEKKKAIAEHIKNRKSQKPKTLSFTGIDVSKSPFLSALAAREELVWNGRMATIIFIRVCPQEEQEEAEDGTKSENSNKRKSEISGYIDLGYRLKTDDFRAYFEGRKHLIPRPSDLSYYNWATQHAQLQDSPNFRVEHVE